MKISVSAIPSGFAYGANMGSIGRSCLALRESLVNFAEKH